MSDLFKLPDTDDKYYNHVKKSKHKEDIRNYLNSLWQSYKPYCGDTNFINQFSHDLISRWWEMYIASILTQNNFNIIKHCGEGPDFKIIVDGTTYNIEAVVPTQGEGPDASPDYEFGSTFSYSDEKLLLRLTHAVWEKNKKFEKYLKDGIVAENDINIIAINLSKIDMADEMYRDSEVPIVAKCFLGFDDIKYEMPIDLITGETGQAKAIFEFREKILKFNESVVLLKSFVDGTYPLISGVFVSAERFVDKPDDANGLWTLTNPTAKNRISDTVFRFGTEWKATIEGDKVKLNKKDYF